jgi:HSP20 family protein
MATSAARDVRAGQPGQRAQDRIAKGGSMAVVKWNPFRELDEIQARLNRWIGEPLARHAGDEGLYFSSWSPAVDIQETEQEYLIKADLPEVKKEDVKVELLDGALTIEGERKLEKEEKGKRFHKVEREYGKFVRRFGVPNEVDAGKVQAEFKDGVLNVHLPKSAAAQPKAIEVRVS